MSWPRYRPLDQMEYRLDLDMVTSGLVSLNDDGDGGTNTRFHVLCDPEPTYLLDFCSALAQVFEGMSQRGVMRPLSVFQPELELWAPGGPWDHAVRRSDRVDCCGVRRTSLPIGGHLNWLTAPSGQACHDCPPHQPATGSPSPPRNHHHLRGSKCGTAALPNRVSAPTGLGADPWHQGPRSGPLPLGRTVGGPSYEADDRGTGDPSCRTGSPRRYINGHLVRACKGSHAFLARARVGNQAANAGIARRGYRTPGGLGTIRARDLPCRSSEVGPSQSAVAVVMHGSRL